MAWRQVLTTYLPVLGTAWVACAKVDHPFCRVRKASGGGVEIILEHYGVKTRWDTDGSTYEMWLQEQQNQRSAAHL